MKKSHLPKLNRLSDSPNVLADDLSRLLDGALQNQLEVLSVTKKSQDSVKNNTFEIKNNLIKEEYFSSSGDELENEFYEDQQDKNSNVSIVQNRKCYVKLVKLPDELINYLKSNRVNECNENIFKCNDCDYSNPLKKNLRKHIRRIHTRERPFACHLCNYRGRCKRHLTSHMKIHLGLFKCDLCNYKTERRGNFNVHVLTHSIITTKTVCCTVCSYKCATRSDLYGHMKLHRKKAFICNICGKSYRYKCVLTEHMFMHTGEKPFGCNICQFKTIYKSNLAAHMKTHTENYLTCNVCKFRTVDEDTLRCHMIIHRGLPN